MGVQITTLPLLFFVISNILHARSDPDYTTLVYKGCAKQALSDPTGTYSQALSGVTGILVSQSTKTKFYKTSSGYGSSSVSGLFQCLGDLTNTECYDCVMRLPTLTDRLCGGRQMAARVQLRGCYLSYEIAGFAQISGLEMLYNTCGSKNSGDPGFEETRDTAFTNMENGVSSAGGFYTINYQNVYVVGQCEGDLGTSDCADCVKNAVQKAQVECGNANSGQIYLHKCFISYSYYPNGVPKRSSSPFSQSPTGHNMGKTVAIILGGTAGLGFVVICMMFARSLIKKKDDY